MPGSWAVLARVSLKLPSPYRRKRSTVAPMTIGCASLALPVQSTPCQNRVIFSSNGTFAC